MGQAQLATQHLSIEEWLALEESTGERYEYHFGQVFAMAGGTINHTRIARNAVVALDNHFTDNGKNCEAFQAELKVEINEEGRYVYPDTQAVCGDVEESENVTGAITNPRLVVEVTSESSGDYDRGAKFRYYSRLPSVREYLILEQTQMAATLYRRDEADTLFRRSDYEGGEAVLELRSVDLEVPLEVFYRRVEFAGEEAKVEV